MHCMFSIIHCSLLFTVLLSFTVLYHSLLSIYNSLNFWHEVHIRVAINIIYFRTDLHHCWILPKQPPQLLEGQCPSCQSPVCVCTLRAADDSPRRMFWRTRLKLPCTTHLPHKDGCHCCEFVLTFVTLVYFMAFRVHDQYQKCKAKLSMFAYLLNKPIVNK